MRYMGRGMAINSLNYGLPQLNCSSIRNDVENCVLRKKQRAARKRHVGSEQPRDDRPLVQFDVETPDLTALLVLVVAESTCHVHQLAHLTGEYAAQLRSRVGQTRPLVCFDVKYFCCGYVKGARDVFVVAADDVEFVSVAAHGHGPCGSAAWEDSPARSRCWCWSDTNSGWSALVQPTTHVNAPLQHNSCRLSSQRGPYCVVPPSAPAWSRTAPLRSCTRPGSCHRSRTTSDRRCRAWSCGGGAPWAERRTLNWSAGRSGSTLRWWGCWTSRDQYRHTRTCSSALHTLARDMCPDAVCSVLPIAWSQGRARAVRHRRHPSERGWARPLAPEFSRSACRAGAVGAGGIC